MNAQARTARAVVRARHGDVDADGQIVDQALLERLRAAIGPYRSRKVSAERQLADVVALLGRRMPT